MLRERDGPHREGEEPKPMMHGHEKSDLVIVAVKPTNKARKAPCGGVCRGGRSGVGGAKGGGQGEYAPAKHVLNSEPGSRVTGAGAYTATCAVTHPRQEPYAGKPHVRIWAGACHEMHVPTATTARVDHAARRRGSRVGRSPCVRSSRRCRWSDFQWRVTCRIHASRELIPSRPQQPWLCRGTECGDRISLGGGSLRSTAGTGR